MKTKAELDSAMAQAGFKPDQVAGGYRKEIVPDYELPMGVSELWEAQNHLWVSESQARDALRAAENDITWTEDDVEPLSETLAKRLTEFGIH